jgi:hypothetical protein
VIRELRRRAENGETNLDAVVGAQVDKAIAKGDTRAAEFLRDTLDGRPSTDDAASAGQRAPGTQNANRTDEVLHIGDLADGELPPDVAFPDQDSQKAYQ